METASVSLSCGCIALVDAADLPRVDGISWTVNVRRRVATDGEPGTGRYTSVAARIHLGHGARKNLKLHRYILDAPPAVLVDHINGDPLDNRRANLRFVDHSGNAANRRPHGSSGYKGVSFDKKSGMWSANIKKDCRQRYLGLFSTPEQAAEAYDIAARELFGQFAWLNSEHLLVSRLAVDAAHGGDADARP
jgi:hypothetical protein